MLVKPGWVVVENLVQNRLGHATFGLLASFTALATVVAAACDLGLTHLSVQRLAAEPAFWEDLFPSILPLRAGLGGLGLGGLLAIGWALGYANAQLGWLAVIGLSLLLTQYGQFLRGALQARQYFNADSLLSIVEKALLLAFVLLLLPTAAGLTLTNYLGARVVAAGLTALLVYGLLTRLLGRVRVRWRPVQLRALFGQSLPFALITVLYGLNERLDMVLLERLASPREAGYYAGAYRWLDAAMMYTWTIMPLFFAKFAATSSRPDGLPDRAAQQALLAFGQRVTAVPLLLVVAFILFRGEILFWQFTHSSAAELGEMTRCLKILFINVLIHAFFALYATLLNSTGHVRVVSWLVMLSVVVNVGLNAALVPSYGATAAAASTLVCGGLVAGGYVWLLPRRAGLAVPWALLGQLLGVFGGTCVAWAALQRWAGLSWLPESGLASLVFVALLLALGVVRPAELRQLRKAQ